MLLYLLSNYIITYLYTMKRFIFVFSLLALFLGTTNTVSLARTNVTDESCLTTSDDGVTSTVTVTIDIKYETPCLFVSLDQDGNKGLFSNKGLSAKSITLTSVYLHSGNTKNQSYEAPRWRLSGSSGGLPYNYSIPLFA